MSLTSGNALPVWAAEIVSRYESGAAGEFILHGNVADRMLLPAAGGGRLGRLGEFLLEALLPKFSVVLSYDPGMGLKVERGREIFAEWPSAREGEMPALPLPAVRMAAHFLQYARNVRTMGGKTFTVAVILRDAQLWLPALPQTLNHELNAIASVIRSWASDGGLGEYGQAVFVVTDRLNHLHPLVAENPRAAEIAIPLPSVADVGALLELLAASCPAALPSGAPLSRWAQRLAGTSIAALESYLKQRQYAGQPLRDEDLGDLRKTLVQRDAGDLIEFLAPDRTLDDVAGLEGVKIRLRQDLELWRRGENEALPMGYLFCGPVGTGKTWLAECLAGEAGVPVVVLRNFRDRWMGSTEANLEKIFALLHALGRCIVFVDEADQALGRREGGTGDSGVGSRVYSMLAAEMSSARNRGRILWVLASSRPDLIEVDLKRPGRIDVKIPIFPAIDRSEGIGLLSALCRKRGIDLTAEDCRSLEPFTPPWLTPGAAEALAVKARRLQMTGMSGAAAALRAALEGYLPPVDPAVIRAQMALAAAEATDAEFVPQEVRDYLAEAP